MLLQKYFSFLLIFISTTCWAMLPTQPKEQSHPASAFYPYTLQQEKFKIRDRVVDVYLPQEALLQSQKIPFLVFGHGQAIDNIAYDLTFRHLAQKGIAVIAPM